MDFCTKCGAPVANQAVCPNCAQRTTNNAVTPPTSVSEKREPQIQHNIAVLGAVCYVAGWISGLVMFSVYRTMPHDDPRRSFLLFHAVQSMVAFGGLTIVYLALSSFPVILMALLALGIALWLLLMFKAFQGYKFKLPIAGDFTESFIQRQ